MERETSAQIGPVELTGKVETTVNPVLMSFPAILRNPKLADRFAHLHGASAADLRVDQSPVTSNKRSREEREGKRWVRRRENGRFVNNPHVVQAGSRDIQIDLPSIKRTFPEPLPSYLPRSVSAPAAGRPVFDAASASMGRYSMSLKGMRRTLRGHGPRAQMLVRDIEKEIKDWLTGAPTILTLPEDTEDLLLIHGRPIGNTLTVTELTRTPLQLVWSIEQDGFARYIVHCCARYHKVVSYSKDVDGRRLTFLLRPNITRSDYAARNTLDTPPATESDYSLGVPSESDIPSVEENEHAPDSISDADETPARSGTRHRRLSSVSERENESDVDNTPRPPTRLRPSPENENEELAEYADADESVNGDLAQSVDSLDLNPITGEAPIRYPLQLAGRIPLRERRGVSRTSSSPSHSRSPCPPSRRSRKGRNRLGRRVSHDSGQSFYDFLYS